MKNPHEEPWHVRVDTAIKDRLPDWFTDSVALFIIVMGIVMLLIGNGMSP